MIEIGGQPILWHIMKIYSHYGIQDFIICAGYKQHVIKEYFADYYLYRSDVTYDFTSGNVMKIHSNVAEPWRVTVVDTGYRTMTGGRIKRIQPYVGNEPFLLTYGDGVSDVNISALVEYHRAHKKIATLTAINPGQRFGVLDISGDGTIKSFREKNGADGGYINGGFMVLEPELFRYLKDDDTVFEKEPLSALARDGQLTAYTHDGFWKCMDTQRDKEQLDELWASGHAPWQVWQAGADVQGPEA